MSPQRLEFHPLTFVEEHDGITVGRPDAESYATLPEDGAALLRRLSEGMPVPDAADWYRAEFGESIDMEDFVAALHELRFIREDGESPAVRREVRFQRLGRAVFSPLAWSAYAALVVAALAVLVLLPALRPHADHVFFTSSLVAVQIVLTLSQVPAILLHESFHVLAGRRLGLPSRLSVGRRLYFLVVQTELDGLLSVPRRRRYLPFLAGMLADVLLFSLLTVTAALTGPNLVGRLGLAVAYLIVLRLAWQFYVFLRTDLYFVFTTALGCTNLHEATTAWLRGKFSRLPGVRESTSDDEDWSPRDRRVAPWFALISVAGVAFLLVTLAVAVVPVVAGFAVRTWTALTQGTSGGAGFWDSAVSVLLIVVQVVLLVVVSRRDRTSRKEAA
ncbi:hypothetical protein [Lentzea sp. NPDC060358]|uniref:hypothetical protein n=1 Tax=Lentzea sp. NPDC060358 TaxID=3347103 RepID=UPI00365E8BE8